MMRKRCLVFLIWSLLSIHVFYANAAEDVFLNENAVGQLMEDYRKGLSGLAELEGLKSSFEGRATDQTSPYSTYVEALIHLERGEFDKGYTMLHQLIDRVDYFQSPVLYREALISALELDRYFWNVYGMQEHGILLKEWSQLQKDHEAMVMADYALADVYYNFYDNSSAYKLVDEAFAMSVQDNFALGMADYHRFWGMLTTHSGAYEEAVEHYKDALAEVKEQSYQATVSLEKILRNHLAYDLAMEGNTDEAIEMTEVLIQMTAEEDAHERMVYYRTKGMAELESGAFLLAVDSLEKAYGYAQKVREIPDSDPYILVIQPDLADAYLDNGQYQKAAEMYRAVNDYYMDMDESVLEEAAAAISEYEIGYLEEQLTLAEQLQASQIKALDIEKRQRLISNFVVVLLLAVVGLILWDVRNNRAHQKALLIQSITDHLTQVFNRGKIIELFEENINKESAVILMDVDDFKMINDTHGHIIGDEVLRIVADVTKSSIREQDHIGRYGGEEFLIVLTKCNQKCVTEIAERIRSNIEGIQWPYEGLRTTASLGCVITNGKDSDALLHDADVRMYEAKRRGKNCVVFE